MTEEKMEKAALCEEELDKVAGGVWKPQWLRTPLKPNAAALDSEEVETLMGDLAQSKMEYEVRK